jgi:hypothetical protein
LLTVAFGMLLEVLLMSPPLLVVDSRRVRRHAQASGIQ